MGLIGAACSGGARQRASVPGERPFRLEESAGVAISPGSGITTWCVPQVDKGLSYLYAVFYGAEDIRRVGECSKNGELGSETLSMMLTFLR